MQSNYKELLASCDTINVCSLFKCTYEYNATSDWTTSKNLDSIFCNIYCRKSMSSVAGDCLT